MLTTDQQTTNEPQHHLLPYRYFHQEVKHGRGDIILVRPNGMHSIHPIAQHPHVTDTFQFHLDMIGSSIVDQVSLHYLQPLQNSSYKFVHCIKPHMAGYDQIKTCLLSIFAISREEDRHFELLLKSRLHEFLYLLYYYHYVTRKHTDDTYRKNEKIRQLIDYINTHYQKPLTIDFLANAMGYSKTHFMTVFKQHTGTPCTEFIIQVRLSKACELLINSIQPILEIANEVGFNSLSNFNWQFKSYYLLTPSQYRKKYTKPKVGRTMINPPKLQKKTPF